MSMGHGMSAKALSTGFIHRTEGLVDSFSQGLERPYSVSSSILQGIEPWLKNFHQLLLNPPKKKAILTTIGVLEEPLGNARLHGARLMAALLHTNTPSINQELCRLNTMDLLLVSQHHGQRCLSVRVMRSLQLNMEMDQEHRIEF
ncbi:serine/threonine-protein phosphatase 6 regulatory subunit 2-like, partial [Psammomys obesus]|uniref:serine/threonine-protein phosphatase 6 regulatory subunit 2-like n=1 Tax=Psammomys obesus TaxID=48139 RepID=UPI002452E79E